MDRRFLSLYNNELHHLRHLAAEFAQVNPEHARRLRLDFEGEQVCPDPYVERLLEGFAFLTARVQLKLDAEFPRLTQSLLETIYPEYLAPTPSMAIARFEPDETSTAVADGSVVIPRNTGIRATVRGARTACTYRTAHPVVLAPLRIKEAAYFTSRNISHLRLPPETRARAAIRLRFSTTANLPLSRISLARLVLHLRGADDLPWMLYEEIIAHTEAIRVQAPAGPTDRPTGETLPKTRLETVGFAESESLFPYTARGFQGYRLLREYFSFPQRFLFFAVTELTAAVQSIRGQEFDLIFLLDRQSELLANRAVDQSSFQLHCTPVINLIERTADRIPLTNNTSEFRVVVDNTRAMDYEVFQVESVNGYGLRANVEQEFRPFYFAREAAGPRGAYFNVHRVPLMNPAQDGAGEYKGSDVYLSLVDAAAAPYRTDLKQLGVRVLCTNRHLPCDLARGESVTYSIDGPSTGYSIAGMSTPTLPRPAFPDGEVGWRLVSHLSLNYFSLLGGPEAESASALQQLLKLYAPSESHTMRKQVEGIRTVAAKQIVRRADFPGPITFARGLEIIVTFDETAFEGTGFFVLGSVLEQFFARYASLNSFTETVIKSEKPGEVMRWKARVGARALV